MHNNLGKSIIKKRQYTPAGKALKNNVNVNIIHNLTLTHVEYGCPELILSAKISAILTSVHMNS
jgi:hypothetical protein